METNIFKALVAEKQAVEIKLQNDKFILDRVNSSIIEAALRDNKILSISDASGDDIIDYKLAVSDLQVISSLGKSKYILKIENRISELCDKIDEIVKN